MTSQNISATSLDSLLFDMWHTLRALFYYTASASRTPASSSSVLLLILNSFKFFIKAPFPTLISSTRPFIPSAFFLLIILAHIKGSDLIVAVISLIEYIYLFIGLRSIYCPKSPNRHILVISMLKTAFSTHLISWEVK